MKLGVLFNTDRMSRNDFVGYAQRLDEMGVESLWLPELFTRDPFSAAGWILAKTTTLTVGTGIANVYARDPVAVVSAASTLAELSEGRFILGLGVSNAGLAKARGHSWQSPVGKLSSYLTAMREARLTSPQIGFDVHVAAHGPKMLDIARTHADGANTYLMPPQHVSRARAIVGPDSALNTMLFCLADADPSAARTTARKAVNYYMGLDYYHRAWREMGYDDADFTAGGSDRLIDAVVAWGDLDAIRTRVEQQREEGASRVIVIPIGRGGAPDWKLLEGLVA